MITKSNLKNMLKSAGFSDTSKDKYEKNYPSSDCSIIVDFRNEKIIYPEDKGFKVNVATTTNFSEPENFVVLECVNRLLDKGYRPENIELERTWTLGHEQKSGRADICVSNQNGKMLFIVECKTFGVEYNKEMKNILSDGGQLISYWQQERGCRWLVLYASNINSSNDIEYITDSIDCSDDENILNLARKDATILLYKDAHTASELYDAWKETYEQRFSGDIIFRDDSVAYDIGVKPLRKKDLKDFSENDKIVNRFEEILRHNNVSDKENAFNRLIALFICKLVDEIQKTDNDIVEFGATGTNTVILFLQKFNEPPKRTDMVLDSVEAILSKADIDGWEDESILRGYLKKIGVKKDIYNKLLSKSEDYTHWKDDNYFGQHYDEFVTSTEYVKKSKQKTFLKLSDAEQKKWFNQKFYEYVFSIEEEKLFYYSLVYNQDTLIISAPDENKEQEKFLGYKWSNRKGQEGIQIIKAGGCLYNASDRSDNNSIAGLIRNAFSDEDEFDVEDLSDYYYRLRLQDMLDFSGTTFNKSIKSTPTRVLKDIPGLTNYRLSDKNFFDLSIGNRVLSDEVVENGSIPIYSANVFEEFGRIDKQNITDFSVPSILWGIDGDWMVNIMPADKPFYPTDHCGVLRIKTEDILPKYMALALQVEGEFERFSRSNRASTQRIANLIIQVPSVSEQQKIVDEIEAIDKRIADEQAIISEQSAKVKFKFVEMFGDNPATTHGKNSVKLSTLCENLDNERKPITEHLRNKGDIPYYGASGIVDYVAEYIFDETLLLISEDGANLVSRNMPIAFSITGKSWVNNHVHILRFKNYKLQKYVESYINNIDLSEYINKNANPKLTQEKLNSIMIYMPNDTTLDLYISSIDQCDKLKFEAQERLEELNAAREDIIDKYFR